MGVAAWRDLPVLREVQGRAASRAGTGIAVRAEPARLRDLSRSVEGIPLARLCCVLRDLFGLDISEGALVNILDAGRAPFATQAGRIRFRFA